MTTKKDTSGDDPRLEADLWAEVDSLVPGGLVTEDEAVGYVTATLSDADQERVESLLAKNPALHDKCKRQREEFASHYTPQKERELEQAFGKLAAPKRQPVAESETGASGDVIHFDFRLQHAANAPRRTQMKVSYQGDELQVFIAEQSGDEVLITAGSHAVEVFEGRTLVLEDPESDWQCELSLTVESGEVFGRRLVEKSEREKLGSDAPQKLVPHIRE